MSKKLNQKGAVSLLSVVIFATIITVLITAYMRSAVSQQAEALTYDTSNRAYYAAESGIQDTLRLLKSQPSLQASKTDCQPLSGSDFQNFGYPNYGVSYTCQRITANTQDLSGTVSPNAQSAILQLSPPTGITPTSVVVRWSIQHVSTVADPKLYPRAGASSLFTPNDKWFANGLSSQKIHALLRVEVISEPNSSGFDRSQIRQRVLLLNPTTAANSDTNGAITLNQSALVPAQQDQFITNARCYPSDSNPSGDLSVQSGAYSCIETINLSGYSFSNSNVFIRVGSIYKSTKFSVQLMNGTTPVNLSDGQIDIDITGKAGENTYRRLKQKVSLGGFQIQYGPDAALVAGEGICKNFVIGTAASTYQQGCNPLN